MACISQRINAFFVFKSVENKPVESFGISKIQKSFCV